MPHFAHVHQANLNTPPQHGATLNEQQAARLFLLAVPIMLLSADYGRNQQHKDLF